MRIEALMIRIFKEMLRDKRTLALMFIAPLFIMTLIFFLFQSNTTTKVDLAVHGVQTSLTKAMDTKHLRLHHVGTEKPTRIIKQHDYAGVLTQHGNQLTLTLANTDQGQSTLLKQTLQAATVKLRLKAAATSLKTQAIALNKLTDALQQATHGAVQVPIPQQPKQTNYRMTTHYRYGSSESTYFDTL
ncbi:ABC transporter permease, partial [Lacticaseibacillus rhamnosus]